MQNALQDNYSTGKSHSSEFQGGTGSVPKPGVWTGRYYELQFSTNSRDSNSQADRVVFMTEPRIFKSQLTVHTTHRIESLFKISMK